jgi:TATA-binding protein-associated factor Taf7
MKDKDIQGRTYANMNELKPGDIVTVDSGFDCLEPWSQHVVEQDLAGELFIWCAGPDGEYPAGSERHHLEGQLNDDSDALVGVYPGVVEERKMIDRDEDEARIEAVRQRHVMNRNPSDESWRDIDALLAMLDHADVDKEEELRAQSEAYDEELSALESEIEDLRRQLDDGLIGLSMRAAEELSLP